MITSITKDFIQIPHLMKRSVNPIAHEQPLNTIVGTTQSPIVQNLEKSIQVRAFDANEGTSHEHEVTNVVWLRDCMLQKHGIKFPKLSTEKTDLAGDVSQIFTILDPIALHSSRMRCSDIFDKTWFCFETMSHGVVFSRIPFKEICVSEIFINFDQCETTGNVSLTLFTGFPKSMSRLRSRGQRADTRVQREIPQPSRPSSTSSQYSTAKLRTWKKSKKLCSLLIAITSWHLTTNVSLSKSTGNREWLVGI